MNRKADAKAVAACFAGKTSGARQVPSIRVEKRQTVKTLISEEALLFAKYLGGECETWVQRIPSV